jgi:hypothetical protein
LPHGKHLLREPDKIEDKKMEWIQTHYKYGFFKSRYTPFFYPPFPFSSPPDE